MRLLAAGGDAIFNGFVVEDDIRIQWRDDGRTMVVFRAKIYKELKVVIMIRHENRTCDLESRQKATNPYPRARPWMVKFGRIVIYKGQF